MSLAPTASGTDCAALPAGACDTHVHVFDPARFPYAPARRYTPAAATVTSLRRHLDALRLERVVLVQPSVYGTDHGCLLDALATFGPTRARGVAVLQERMGEAALAVLHAAGLRAARLNLEVDRARDPAVARARLRALARQVPPGWRLCLHGSLSVLAALADDIAELPTAPVIEHFGMARIAEGGAQASGFDALLRLLAEGRAFIKFSGPYQISAAGPGYADVAPVARALAGAAGGRVLWGSNWPHTAGAQREAAVPSAGIEAFRVEDDARNLALLEGWLADAAAIRHALAEAPALAFGFD